MRTVQINHKALLRFLLILLMIWIVWWPIVTSGNIRMDSDRMIHTPDVALTQYVREGRIALLSHIRRFSFPATEELKNPLDCRQLLHTAWGRYLRGLLREEEM